ncbi:hypothetical protein XBO1_520002 [Xenorhabdus bovienii str. oregonense]|uniref:Uncharacterized protein n=1 Tax=Xenorhabdus bovienii str. oregonense TaxID=1398202 RepID=A0A077P9J5_XENBV|nr:hypothetical protein XBO1_520002 [Xenorhabdus bovienii str. oregonense]
MGHILKNIIITLWSHDLKIKQDVKKNKDDNIERMMLIV